MQSDLGPIDFMAVVVVYERDLDQVQPWPMLHTWLKNAVGSPGLRLKQLLIYDNSAKPRAKPLEEVACCSYVHDPRNGGTAAAYAFAAAAATELELEWLLLLDHDTMPTKDFLTSAGSALRSETAELSVVAVVPRVRHQNGAFISPVRVTRAGTMQPLRPGQKPCVGEHLSAIASGSLLHVPTLMALLPLPNNLWLDYVDHWIFAQLHHRGLKTVVLDEVMQHDLSIATPASISPGRLVSILEGEAQFYGLLGLAARVVYPWRVAWRILRLACSNPRLSFHGIRWIARRGRLKS